MFIQQKSGRIFCCVADDTGETCVRLTEALNRRGAARHDVICARDIRSALWWLSNEHFDLYIVGRNFPDGTGLELCQQIREFDQHTPVIFYSEDAGEAASRLAAGAQAYMVKPEIEELALTVLRLLDDKGLAAA